MAWRTAFSANACMENGGRSKLNDSDSICKSTLSRSSKRSCSKLERLSLHRPKLSQLLSSPTAQLTDENHRFAENGWRAAEFASTLALVSGIFSEAADEFYD